MNPYKLREIYKYLTRAKKADPSLPDVFSASKAPIPAKTQNVQETEAINQFMLRNPRVEKAGGGRIGFYKGKLVTEGSNKGKYAVYNVPESVSKTRIKYFPNEKSVNKWIESRPGQGRKDFGKFETGSRFKGTIQKHNLEKVKKLEEVVTKSNSQYKKSLSSKAALEAVGFKDGYQAIQSKGALRDAVKEKLSKLLTTQKKIDNYVNNVMLAEDALVKDFKNPISHIAKKFGVSRVTVGNWARDSQVYKDNKNIFTGLSRELNYNKYKFVGDGVPRLMSDYSIIMQNKLPTSLTMYGGDKPSNFIMQSAYRNFIQNKTAGKNASVTFVGNPELLPQNEWQFIKNGKLYSLDPSVDEIEFNGKTYKNNYLARGDAKDIYKKDFGKVYKVFDDLDKYMNTTTVVGNKDVKLDTVLRQKLFEATGKKNYLLRRAVEIDHFDINKDPFSNLRLLDRRTNVQAGILKRLPKYKNNPKLLNKVLTDIGYTTPYKDVDTFIKRTTRNIDTPIKVIGNQRLKPPSGSGAVTLGALDLPSMFKRLSPATRKLVGGTGGFILPEVIFYELDKANRMSKGQSEKEAAAGALESGTLGLYENKAYMEELKKVAESMGIDSSTFDSAYELNVLNKSYQQNSKNVDDQMMTALENQDVKTSEELRKNFNKYLERIKPEFERLQNDIAGRISGGSPLQMSKAKDTVTEEQFQKPFYDMQDVAMEKLKQEKQSVFPKIQTKYNPAEGSMGTGFFNVFDSLTQGAKNLIQGRVVPYASKIGLPQYEPKASERQITTQELKNIDPRELQRFNLGRGFTYDNPVRPGDIETLQYEQPGVFFAGGGIAKMAGDSSGRPPASGPNPQGLLSLKNRVRNY